MSILAWWREILIIALLGACGVQSYRLLGTQGEFAVYKTERESQDRENARESAMTASFDKFNERRSNEELHAARAAATSASLRPPAIPSFAADPSQAGVGNGSTVCADVGELDQAFSGFARRELERREKLLRVSLEILAYWRSCRAWADGVGVGGQIPPGAPPSPQEPGSPAAPKDGQVSAQLPSLSEAVREAGVEEVQQVQPGLDGMRVDGLAAH